MLGKKIFQIVIAQLDGNKIGSLKCEEYILSLIKYNLFKIRNPHSEAFY